MSEKNKASQGLVSTKPTMFERLRRYQREEGGRALVRKMGDIAIRSSLAYAALATYYPAVAFAAIRWRLRPAATILRRIEGECRHTTGRFAIFLVYQPEKTPWYVENALHALRQARINVLLVFNHELDAEREAFFREFSSGIIIRNNAGLDIGGYRDGFLELRDDPRLERLLFLNDSVYYFSRGLTAFFDRLMASEADVSAPFENRQHHYHIQSFCLAISGRLAKQPSIRAFFDDYLPINSRRWAIHKGEVAFSHLLTATTERIDILYRVEDLRGRETDLAQRVDGDIERFLPINLRRRYEWMRRNEVDDTVTPLETFVRLAGLYSQVHTAGFLFRLLLDCPIIKRDLVFREQFKPDDARDLLSVAGDEGHLDDMMTDLCRKGEGSSLRGLDRGRYVAGMA